MRVIGLTGGIASGKSTVAKILGRLGAVVIDADELSREVVAPGEAAYKDILAEFGERIVNPDRTINRSALGEIVFADPGARNRLERITHPAIGRRAGQKLGELTFAQLGMAPLLIEAGASARVDEIWVIYADQATQLHRLMKRDGMSRDQALQRIAAQMPMDEKKKFGRVVIDNRGTPEGTERQVREIWEKEIKSPK